VLASGEVVSVRAEREFTLERLMLAINGTSPRDLVVRVGALFVDALSARFSAIERAYDYVILNRGFPSALWRARAWHVVRPIDDARFVAAAAPLAGEHDFVSFCGELPPRGGTVREVFGIVLVREGDLLRVTVRGNAFLHHMVRVMVGTLVACATGARDVEFAARALAARRREAAGPTAPPQGLYLAGVRYAGLDTYRPVSLAP
jgi:tRNA pseudouridine38-40 synthase